MEFALFALIALASLSGDLPSPADASDAAPSIQLDPAYDGLPLTENEREWIAQCKPDDAASCDTVGLGFLEGQLTDKDDKRPRPAMILFDKGCQYGSFSACSRIGYAYLVGENVDQNITLARVFLEKACSGNDGAACNNLGLLLVKEDYAGRNPKAGFEIFKQSCLLDDDDGCFHVGVSYHLGIGTEKAPKLASKFFKKACKMGEESACSALDEIAGKKKD
jgi:uncharacterized protein